MSMSAVHPHPRLLRPLLSSFPTPPTHIPLSPVLGPPPTAPLPPLPDAPSPVTPAEQIAFISLRRVSLRPRPSRTRPASQASSEGSAQELVIHDDEPTPAQTPTAQAHTVPSHDADLHGDDARDAARDTARDTARDGSTSPDIAVLIEQITPGRRRRTRSFHSHGPPAHLAQSLKRLRSTPALGKTCADKLPYELWRGRTVDDAAVALDVDMDDDDDSADDMIDLHTPLPHLMLRAGLLSPHSKLLPRPTPSPEPVPAEDEGRVSPAASVDTAASHANTLSTKSSTTSLSTVASTASTSTTATSMTTTSTPPLRDARDTARRRARHKDGRLLRGGIGLTTGLGWSDSEDEDAPSALTNRLSRLAPALSRKSSKASSVASGASSASGYGLTPGSGYTSPGGYFAPGVPFGGGYGSSLAYAPASGHAPAAPTSAPVSRTSSVASSPARIGVLSLGPEGRSLSRSTASSQHSLRRTGSSASSGSVGAGSAAGDVAGPAPYEGRESALLAYLEPPLETEERVYEARRAGSRELKEGATDVAPEYPYSYQPPSPTDVGHSSVGHGDADDGVQRPFLDAARAQPPPVTPAVGDIQQLQIQVQNQVDQSLQHRQLHQKSQRPPALDVLDDDRSPTPTCTSAPPGEATRLLPLAGTALPPRKSSMPALGAVARERSDDVPALMLRMQRGVRGGPGGVGVGPRPVSKALPPLPADFPRGSTTPASAVPRPQSRTSSGIPKTASLSSLRSTASRQGERASPPSVPIPASPSLSMSASTTVLRRERAASNASMQSVRSVRSVASAASVSTATGGARPRPSLPTPKASTPPSPAPPTGSHIFTYPLATASTLGARKSMSPPPPATLGARVRKRTSSTSSTASARPLKSAIKAPGGMAVPRARYVSEAAPPVGVGVGVGAGHTGIAI